jgi:hypothetical protein
MLHPPKPGPCWSQIESEPTLLTWGGDPESGDIGPGEVARLCNLSGYTPKAGRRQGHNSGVLAGCLVP